MGKHTEKGQCGVGLCVGSVGFCCRDRSRPVPTTKTDRCAPLQSLTWVDYRCFILIQNVGVPLADTHPRWIISDNYGFIYILLEQWVCRWKGRSRPAPTGWPWYRNVIFLIFVIYGSHCRGSPRGCPSGWIIPVNYGFICIL